MRAIFSAQPGGRIRMVWAINSKDLILGLNPASGDPKLTWRGNPRVLPLVKRRRLFRSGVVIASKTVQRIVANLFFRRVSPAETMIYAFIRNTFAVISMLFIIWRAATALSRAENAFETRMLSKTCYQSQPTLSNIQIVFAIPGHWDGPGRHIPNVTIQVSSLIHGASERSCSSRTLFSNSSWAAYEGDNIFGWEFSVFDCNRSDVSDAYAELNVRIQELNGELHLPDIPHLWVSNKLDTFNRSSEAGSNESQVMKSVVPWRSPSWRLRPGFHLSADAGFVTRRFVTSSIFHDVILQKEPIYQEMAIYPISTIRADTSNDNATATATISLSFQQKSIFRTREKYQERVAINLCDYLDDYRSSTIFDIVGSIGGLFALLQSLHVLLFGRPMLWGLTSAKLITPFGLLGQFSSKKFKERLSQQYHRLEPASGPHPGDAAEDIRLGAFLRDFVIEFGPADTEDTPERSNTEAQPANIHEPTGSRQSEIPLLPMPHVDRLSIEDNFIGNENTPSVSNDMGGRV